MSTPEGMVHDIIIRYNWDIGIQKGSTQQFLGNREFTTLVLLSILFYNTRPHGSETAKPTTHQGEPYDRLRRLYGAFLK